MILSCPECATRFMVPDEALLPKGRNVKCGKCEYKWFADPPARGGDDEPIPEPVSVTPLDPDEQSHLRPRNLPAIAGSAPARSAFVAWGLLVVMLGVLGSVLWFGRIHLAVALPFMQPVYQSVGVCVGTADPESSFRISGDSQPTLAESGELVIERQVRRDSACATYVPDLVVEFLDTDGAVLSRARLGIGIDRLEPGEWTPFTVKIDEWPDKLVSVNLLFTIPNVKS